MHVGIFRRADVNKEIPLNSWVLQYQCFAHMAVQLVFVVHVFQYHDVHDVRVVLSSLLQRLLQSGSLCTWHREEYNISLR